MRGLIVFLITLSFAAGPASADVFFCEGKWSSTPCDEDSRAVNLPGISRGGSGVPTPPESALDTNTPAPDGAADQESAQPPPVKTRLRVHGDPIWMLKNHGRSVELTSGTVNVKNVGNADADGVRVTVVIPGVEKGEAKLEGPTSIGKGATAKYSLPDGSSYFVAPTTSLYAKVYCDNCWH